MVHGFSDSDKGKKPINMYYDFSTSKVYAYDDNEELQEVSIGGGNNLISTFSETLVSTSSDTIMPPNEANYIRIRYYNKSQYVTPYVVINGTQTQLTETFKTFAISGNFTIKQTDQYSNNSCAFYIEFYRNTP